VLKTAALRNFVPEERVYLDKVRGLVYLQIRKTTARRREPSLQLHHSTSMNPRRISHHCLKLLVLLAPLALLAIGCSKKNASDAPRRGGIKFPVEVATVAARDVDLVVHAVGSVEAFEIVQVTARVAGVVQNVRFREGEMVQAGAQLVEIEPERYRLALQSAQAALEKAKASLREAQSGLTRRVDIEGKNPGFVSTEDLENWQTRVLSLQADSAQAAANMDLAELNLRDAYVPAPVAGLMQSRAVRTGQYVQEGTVIATMVRRDPLLLRFTVPDEDARRIHPGLEATFTVRESGHPYTARITAVTGFADPVTRMVNVTAEVTDPLRHELRPGSFAEVTVRLGEVQRLPVIPQLCIRPSERGFLAYVVQDSVAHERVVSLGLRSADGYVEVKSGISAGEMVVVRGAEALSDGVNVRVMRHDSADSTASAKTQVES
jgi:multidrug efflux system membrane fusion protein